MSASLHMLLAMVLKLGIVALVINEIRGLVLAAPVIWAIYQQGGEPMAIWIGLCSLGGIALSVIVPAFALKKLQASMPPQEAA